MKQSIILIGSGGHCESLIDVIEDHGGYQILGFWDPQSNRDRVHQYPRLSNDLSPEDLVQNAGGVLVAVGQVKSPEIRIEIFNSIKSVEGRLPVIVSPRAYVSSRASLGEGTVVMPGACINANVVIGKNCIINTLAVIEHGVKVEDHCHISTGAIVNGNCHVEKATFIGSNATLHHGVRIAAFNVIGAGSVVLKDTVPHGTYVGNPARKIDPLS